MNLTDGSLLLLKLGVQGRFNATRKPAMHHALTLGNSIEKRMYKLPKAFPLLPLLGIPSFLICITSPGEVIPALFTSTTCPSKCLKETSNPD